MASLVGKLGSPGRKKRGVSSAQRSVKRISKKYCIMKLEELVSVFGLPALPATKMDKHTRLKALVKTLLFDPRQKLLLNFAALPSSACMPAEMDVLLPTLQSEPCVLESALQTVIMIEVENSTGTTSLFRSNSVGVKLLSAFFLSSGRGYMFHCLKAPIESVLKVDRALEVDPSRMQSDATSKAMDILDGDGRTSTQAFEDLLKSMGVEEVEKNRRELLNLVDEDFLPAIFASADDVPTVLRHTFTFLRECVRLKYGQESSNTALAGFLFLRFFCPFIVAPRAVLLGRGEKPGGGGRTSS
jgi:hypothetical protein